MWDVQKGYCVRIFSKHNGPVTAVAVSPEGKTMASAGIFELNGMGFDS
jgi:transcription initiation factor TFIID subunit 5